MAYIGGNKLDCCSAIIVIALLAFKYSYGSSLPHKGDAAVLKAFIHIGPHSTGCTHIQQFLSDMGKELQAVAYHSLLKPNQVIKSEGSKKKDAVSPYVVAPFVAQARQHRANIIFSASALHSLKPRDIIMLKDMLSGYAVTIVLFYREPLSKVLSIYNHRAQHRLSVDSVLEVVAEGLEHESKYGDVATVHCFSEAFGIDNIIVADYYGILAKATPRRDIVHVFVCEIVGILCDITSKLIITPAPAAAVEAGRTTKGDTSTTISTTSTTAAATTAATTGVVGEIIRQENQAAADMLPIQLTDLVLTYLEYIGCTRPTDGFALLNMTSVVENDLVSRVPHMVKTIQTNEVFFTALQPLALQIDTVFRNTYGQRLMYGNVSANTLARESLSYTELDRPRLLADQQWQDWMHRMKGAFIRRGYISQCSN